MRIRNLKLHIKAVGIICVLVTGLYILIVPSTKSQTGPVVQGDRFIQVDSATWGKNCDEYVDDALLKWQPSQDPAKPNPKPEKATTNNVLLNVSSACNGQLTCSLLIDSEHLGADPFPACIKSLVVKYRCFTFDALSQKEFPQGGTLSLDCNVAENPAPAQ